MSHITIVQEAETVQQLQESFTARIESLKVSILLITLNNLLSDWLRLEKECH